MPHVPTWLAVWIVAAVITVLLFFYTVGVLRFHRALSPFNRPIHKVGYTGYGNLGHYHFVSYDDEKNWHEVKASDDGRSVKLRLVVSDLPARIEAYDQARKEAEARKITARGGGEAARW